MSQARVRENVGGGKRDGFAERIESLFQALADGRPGLGRLLLHAAQRAQAGAEHGTGRDHGRAEKEHRQNDGHEHDDGQNPKHKARF